VPVVGSRFLIEAGFIITVAVIAGIQRLSTWWIIAVVASAWIIVAVVEIVVWARQVVARQPLAVEPEPIPAPAPARVRPQPRVEIPRERVVEPVQERRAEPVPTPVPEPPRIVAVPAPAPEPVREPEPEPEPELVPEPEPQRVVAFIPANDGPKEWNLWELERAARENATDDVVRNEERSYLLMYLRDFAGPDGVLPTDFDGLVRDAFGDMLHTVGA
jgi:outer membrane biosynthesis protein TonB